MVLGLPKIPIPSKVCEEYVQAKKHRGGFSKDAGSNTKCQLKVVYYDVYGPMQVDSIGGNK